MGAVARSGSGRARPWLVALIAFLVYVPGFWWGAPRATAPDRVEGWGVDDETPLGPLAEMHNIIDPKPSRNLGYPLGYAFMATAAYAPYLGWLKLTGGMGAVSGDYPFGLEDPVAALRVFALIAHFLTVLLATGVVVCVYDAARTLWDRRTATAAAALAMVVSPMFYYGRTGNVDVPMLFFIAAAVAMYARAIRHGLTVRNAALLGAAAGVALGTKESSLGFFLVMPFVLGALHWRAVRSARDGPPPWRAPAAGIGAAVLALGLSSGLFVEPSRYIAHIQFLRGRIDMATEGAVIPFTYPNTWSGHLEYATRMLEHMAVLLTWPGLVLAAAGIGWTAVRERKALLLALPALSYVAFMFVTARTAHLRYMLPVGFTIALFAARAALLAWRSGRGWLRMPVTALAVFAFVMPSLQGVDLTWQMLNDSRYEAGRWLAERSPPGTRVEYFGATQKLPPLPEGVVTERATPYYGMFQPVPVDSAQAVRILEGWQTTRPDWVIVIPDHSSKPGQPFDITVPPLLFDGMVEGRFEYRIVAFFQTPRLIPAVPPIPLDYPSVNPPIRIFSTD
jgi:hypothetical protein